MSNLPSSNDPTEGEDDQLVLPNFIDFGNYLHDRIHVQLKHQEYLQGRFTIFLILKNRRNHEALQREFIYAGLKFQRKFLDPNKEHNCPTWEKMKTATITTETLPITSKIMEQYENNTLSIAKDSISFKVIADHYRIAEREEWSSTREIEYQILETYFENPGKLQFIGLPVFQFGEFEGIAQIVFTEQEPILRKKEGRNTLGPLSVYLRRFIKTFTQEKEKGNTLDDLSTYLRRIIKTFTREYEDLLWNWQLPAKGEYATPLKKRIAFNEHKERLFINAETVILNKNKKILDELGYIEYYQSSKKHYARRAEDQQDNIDIFLQENRRRAAMAILVDSFAHNISAHSLTVLKWIFQQRWNKVKFKSEKHTLSLANEDLDNFSALLQLENIDNRFLLDNLSTLRRSWKQQEKTLQNGGILPVRDQVARLDQELTHLFRYLTEKGAFWNGIGREEQFGGEIRNLYEVLYEEFAKNPLFLGTIAYSEGITKLNIKIHFHEKRGDRYVPKGEKDTLKRSYTTHVNSAGIPLEGTLATIDLSSQGQQVYQYDFFQEGQEHDILKSALQEVEVYFPGGVVGRHAFFTLLENTMRDVKHYSQSERERMKEEGLDLVITVYPSKLSPKLRKKERGYSLYKIGIYLACSQQLLTDDGLLGATRLKNAEDDILTSTQTARLGGSQQDKICAAMLLTGSFNRLVKNDTSHDDLVGAYEPWLRFAHYYPEEQAALPPEEDRFEHEFRAGKDQEPDYEQVIASLPEEMGYFKKYIHLWKGEFVVDFTKENDLLDLNLGRYRMVNLRNLNHVTTIRQKGVVRFICNKKETPARIPAYTQWLNRWLNNEYNRINIKVSGSTVGTLLVENGRCSYFNFRDYRDGNYDKNRHATYQQVPFLFAHSQDGSFNDHGRISLSLRSHGILKERFFTKVESIDNLGEGTIDNEEKTFELAEILLTKVGVFDNRIAQRVTKTHRKYLRDELFVDINEEVPQAWTEIKAKGILNYNFLIFHITFIKQIKDKEGKPYSEGNIDRFVEEQIMEGKSIPDNFIFVVTSGRGRQQWWNQIIKKERHDLLRFMTFRPSESLINAVENGVQMDDDFQVKYNLLKILFGS